MPGTPQPDDEGAHGTAAQPRRAPAFRPGQSGKPDGRPKGARNKVSAAFLSAVCADFEDHGAATIERMRRADPVAYVRLCASLIPKQMRRARDPLEEVTDDDLAELIERLRDRRIPREDAARSQRGKV